MFWLENLLSQATIERLGWMLVHFLWQATVVAMLLAVFLRLLRRSGANVRYLAACSALALMVVLPVATIRFIRVAGPAAEAGPLPVTSSAIAPTTIKIVGEKQPLSKTPDSLQVANPTPVPPWNERIASAIKPALPYAVLGWLAGVFGLSAWHLGGWMQLQRLKRRMVRSVGAALQQQAAQLGSRLGVHRAVTLLESALVEVPTVVGWLRPVILLPASAVTGLSTEQLEAILAHELAHIRRYDYLVNVLQTVVEILGFYHPAVWWVSRRIRIERENCCDDVAVHLCGDSVRYARALTCLEEIRHSQAELAVAATGGSLLSRISRLLGQPAPDDRRFAWLPGLITPLLIVGVVIPTALALTAADRRVPEPLPDHAALAANEGRRDTEPNTPARTQVLLNYTLVEVFADRTLDPQTATQARNFLERRPAGNPSRVRAPLPQPSIEDLQRPLRDVLSDSMFARNGDKKFVDLLVSRGYGRVMSTPKLLVLPNEPGTIEIGGAPDPNALVPQGDMLHLRLTTKVHLPLPNEPGTIEIGGAPDPNALVPQGDMLHLRLTTKVHLPQDPNTVLVETSLTLTYPADTPADPNGRLTTTEMMSMSIVPNGQYTAIIERSTNQQRTEDGGKRLHIVLLQPIVNRPGATPAGKANESPTSEPDTPKVSVRTEVSREPNAAESPTVGVKVMMIDAVDTNELDYETIVQVHNILGKPITLPEGQAGRSAHLQMTVGEFLRDYVVQQSLSDEGMRPLVKLLASKGYIKVLAGPQVVVQDGMQGQIKVVNDEYFWMGSSTDGSASKSELQKVEAGTVVDVTPHVVDHNNIRLDIKVELTHVIPGPNETVPPMVSVRSTAATVTTPSGRYITLAGMKEGDAGQAKDSKSLYIMAMPTIVKAPDANQAPPSGSGSNNPASQAKRPEESATELKTRVLASRFAPSARAGIDDADFDPVYQELARKRVEIWGQLTADQQKLTSNHPKVVQEQSVLDAIKKEMDDRKKSLKEEFEARLNEPDAGLAGNVARVRLDLFMADIFSKKLLDDQTAAEAVDIIGGAIPNLTAKDLCRPVGDVVRQYAQYRILSGPPLEAFVDLLVARGYIKRLANPTWLLPAGYRGQIEVGDNLDSPDDASELNLKFTVTPESRPGSDSVQLSLDVGGYRRATAEHGKQPARWNTESNSAGWPTKSGRYTAVSRISHITWYDNQGNERMLFTMVKPTIIDTPPTPKLAQVSTSP